MIGEVTGTRKIGEKKARKRARLSNCYYCQAPTLETELKRTDLGQSVIILECAKCAKPKRKRVKLLKRKVDRCQRV